MSDALFGDDGLREQLPEVERASADRRRTIRQAETIARGGHPLGLQFPQVRRHPETIGQEYGPGIKHESHTCGTCTFRGVEEYHGKGYPKCFYGGEARMTSGSATDCRAWWPGCREWTP